MSVQLYLHIVKRIINGYFPEICTVNDPKGEQVWVRDQIGFGSGTELDFGLEQSQNLVHYWDQINFDLGWCLILIQD